MQDVLIIISEIQKTASEIVNKNLQCSIEKRKRFKLAHLEQLYREEVWGGGGEGVKNIINVWKYCQNVPVLWK